MLTAENKTDFRLVDLGKYVQTELMFWWATKPTIPYFWFFHQLTSKEITLLSVRDAWLTTLNNVDIKIG
jgi:hypothetical protein